MAELSRLLTVKSRFACYLYSIDGVSPPLPLYSLALNCIFIFGMKNNTQSIWKLIYISSYIFLVPSSVPFSRSVVSDSATPWTAAHQASMSITNSRSWPKLMSIELVMPSSHMHWSRNWSGTYHLADHALITWLIIHWSRDWSCTDHMTDHALIT